MASEESKNAYVTLITRPSYLAGAIVLAYTLHAKSPSTPLIILYTPSTFPQPCISALEIESKHSNLVLHAISPLSPPAISDKDLIAERFADTWTKLRAFELYDLGYEKLCFLDADMMVLKDPSRTVFTLDLPTDHIFATHVCVCNLNHDVWAPPDWTPSNCAYTHLTHPSCLTSPTPAAIEGTHSLLNSGMIAFLPSKKLWSSLLQTFQTMPESTLRSYKFPDQDFLTDYFRGKWHAAPYNLNALKTWRYWHPLMWKDDEVCVLHYIVDKPWAKRVGQDGKAGYRGDDGVTHSWWWEEFEKWKQERLEQGEREVVRVVEMYVAHANGGDNEALEAVGSKVQAFAGNRSAENGGEKAVQAESRDQEQPQDHDGPGLGKKMLGERGNGPVVRNHALKGPGRGYMEP